MPQRPPVPRSLTAHTEFLTSRLKIPRGYLDLLEPIKITISLTGTKPDNYSVSDLILSFMKETTSFVFHNLSLDPYLRHVRCLVN